MSLDATAPTPAGGQEFDVDCVLTCEVRGATGVRAVIKACLGGRWVLFDARRMEPASMIRPV